MDKIGIVPNNANAAWKKCASLLVERLAVLGRRVFIPKELFEAFNEAGPAEGLAIEELYAKSDLIIVLGGDGTLLRAAKPAAVHDVPILGINLGRLGYLSELEMEDIDEYLKRIVDGDYNIDTRMMLEVSVAKGDGEESSCLALNEMFVSKQSLGKTIKTNVCANGDFIDSFFGDGVIIATPTGSTAYSLSCGGPVLEPQHKNIVITPISPHALCARPIVMGADREITLRVNELYNKEAYVVCDGELFSAVTGKDRVTVKRSRYSLRLIRVKNRGFYDILRAKLSERRD